ncbi:MAG TPA: hypothetical protein VMP12_10935 [Candidatus Sulfotelmatobacter sp.]|nr:hypothetical protein [Candidatus Sulfotelmatobacter sp.]
MSVTNAVNLNGLRCQKSTQQALGSSTTTGVSVAAAPTPAQPIGAGSG